MDPASATPKGLVTLPVPIPNSDPCVTPEPNSEIPGLLSVIIPVFNEASRVSAAIAAVLRVPVYKEIIVVNDGSNDGTTEILRNSPASPQIRIVHHNTNHGKGAAIRTGLLYARGEFVLIQDADLEYDPNDYSILLEPLRAGRANVVYGVRPKRPDRGISFFVAAELLTVLTNVLYWRRIHDEATGYKVFRHCVLKRIRLVCNRFEFCPEVTAKMCRLGEKIFEVPISYDPRPQQQGKKIRWTDGVQAIFTLLRFRFIRKRRWLVRVERFRTQLKPVSYSEAQPVRLSGPSSAD